MLEPSVMKTLCEMAEDWLSPDAYGAVAIPMPVEGGSGLSFRFGELDERWMGVVVALGGGGDSSAKANITHLEEMGCARVVVVVSTVKSCSNLGKMGNIDVFALSELRYNPARHDDAPMKVVVVDPDEKLRYLASVGVENTKDLDINAILRTDISARYYGLRKGQLVYFKRRLDAGRDIQLDTQGSNPAAKKAARLLREALMDNRIIDEALEAARALGASPLERVLHGNHLTEDLMWAREFIRSEGNSMSESHIPHSTLLSLCTTRPRMVVEKQNV